MRQEAHDVISCEFARADHGALPDLSPGAHMDLQLPAGMVRQYSLVDWSRSHCTIAVKREPQGRGGSRFICDTLRVGDEVMAAGWRNTFALEEGKHPSVLLAGGIGLTPLLPMARRLEALGRNWTLYVATRSPEETPFLGALRAMGQRVYFAFEQAAPARFDLSAIVQTHGLRAHYYACGSNRLLDAFAAATTALPKSQVHLERFSPSPLKTGEGKLRVQLARSGRCVEVADDQTVLDALLAEGVPMSHSCQQGICGQCEVAVLAGLPDHRDSVLTDAERARNDTMMVCCSRALSDEIVLDL